MLLAVLLAVDLMAVLNSPAAVFAVGLLISGLLALHLFMKVADFLDARAARTSNPTEAKIDHVAAWFLRHLDNFVSTSAPDVKALADPAKRAAAEAHMLEQAKAQIKTTIDAAVSGAKVLLCVLVAGLALSCAHVDPIVDTGIGLDTATPLAVATSKAMDSAVKQHMITPQAYAEWGKFLKAFIASYDLLVAEWKAAKSDQNATAAQKAQDALAALVGQLMHFGNLVMLVGTSDGGAP